MTYYDDIEAPPDAGDAYWGKMGRMGQHARTAPPPLPPPMPQEQPQATPEDPGAYWGPMGRMGQHGSPGLPPPQSAEQSGPPMPPQQGGPPTTFPPPNLDPFSKAQADAAAIIRGPNPAMSPPPGGMPGPGVGSNNPMQPPMPPPAPGGSGGGPPGSPMPPPMPGQGGPPPGMTSGGGGSSVPFGPSTDFASSLGIAPNSQERMTSALAGLGKGLSAAAGNSNKAGAVFSRGAGGAITGQISEEQAQQKIKLGLNEAYFNNMAKLASTAMQARTTDARALMWEGTAAMRNALASAGGATSKSFLGTDTGKLHMAETEAQAHYDSERKSLESQKNALSPDDYTSKLQDLENKRQQYVQAGYKKYGVDPNKVDEIRTHGGTMDKPFSQVQNGQWYIDQSGRTVQKTGKETVSPGDHVKWVNPHDASGMNEATFKLSVPPATMGPNGVLQGGYFTSKGKLWQRPPVNQPNQQQLQSAIGQAGYEDNMAAGVQ